MSTGNPSKQKSAGKSLPPVEPYEGKSHPELNAYRAPTSLPEVPQGDHTELRFTRPVQAIVPALVAGVCLAGGLILLINHLLRFGWQLWQQFWWLLIALALLGIAWWLGRHAWRCLRHAYLIVSPVGIEIFPLWRPEQHFRLLGWDQISAMHRDEDKLVVDLAAGGGVVLSLAPLWAESRQLLLHALQGRAQQLGIEWREAAE